MKIHADRTWGKTRASGNLRAAHAFDQAKNQSLAIGFRQSANGSERHGSFVVRSRSLADLVRQFGCGARPPEIVLRAAAGDGGDPAAEGFGGTKRGKMTQRLKEHVVDEIFDVGIWNAGEQDSVDEPGIARVEAAESGAISPATGGDIALVGSCSSFAQVSWLLCSRTRFPRSALQGEIRQRIWRIRGHKAIV